MSAPPLFRDTDGGIKRYATGRETEIEIQDIQALADGTAVNLFTDATAAINVGTSVAADNNITIGPSGNQIVIDNTTGTPLITLDGNVSITGTEDVTGNATFSGDVQLGDDSGDTVTCKGVLVCEADVTLGESTTGGDTITFLGKAGTPANVAFTDAVVTTDISFDGTAQALTNDSANLTVSTTTSGDLLLTGADHVTATVGTTAGDAFAVSNGTKLDLIYVDGNTGNVNINTTTALPSGNEAALTVYQDTANDPVVALSAGGVTETCLLTGSTDPSAGGGVAAPTGSLYMNNTGSLYIKTAAGDTAWALAGTTAGSTLQAAYDAGQTIALVDTKGDLVITVDEVAAAYTDFQLTGTTGDYFQTDAENKKIILGSDNATDITIDVAADVTMTGTSPLITAAALDISITTTTSGDVIINPADQIGLGTASPSANTTATVTATADRVLALENTTDSAIVELQTGTDPSGITGTTGSLYMEYDGTTGANAKLWINQSDAGSGTTWTEISSDASVTLQDAYENGNTIALADAEGDLTITLDEAGTAADFQLTGTTGDYFVTDAANKKIVLGSDNATDVTVDIAADVTMTGTTPLILADSATLTVQTTTSGDIVIDAVDTFVATTDGATTTGFIISSAGLTAVTGKSTADVEIKATGVGGQVKLISSDDTAADAISISANGTGGGVVVTADALLDLNGATVDIDATSASAFTVTGANLTLNTLTTGDVVISSVDALDIDSGSTIDLLATTTFSIDGTGASNVTATSGNLTVSTATTGDLVLTGAGDTDITGTGNVTITTDTAGDNETMMLLTGSDDPTSTAKSANRGSLYMRDDATDGTLFIKQDDGSSTNWDQVATVADAGDVVMTAVAAEGLTLGDLVYLTTTGTAGKADADTAAKVRAVGIALETKLVTETVRIALAGEVAVNSIIAAGQEGNYVFMDDTTAGGVTVTAPSTANDTVLRVGVVTTSGAAGTAKIAISIGEPTLL